MRLGTRLLLRITVGAALGAWMLFGLTIAILAVRHLVVTFSYRHICPDYFSVAHAYVVDSTGRGLDSVAVTMRDNVDFNVIYRTFTDRDGRFELFSDFNSFALHHTTPFPYYVYVAAGSRCDTVRYKFVRHRVCHFRKVDGPDSIVLDPGRESRLVLRLTDPAAVRMPDNCQYAPWVRLALSGERPLGLAGSLPGWQRVAYGSVLTDGGRLYLAAAWRPADATGSGASYGAAGAYPGPFLVVDRNRNGDLSDDTARAMRPGDGPPDARTDWRDGSMAACSDTITGPHGLCLLDARMLVGQDWPGTLELRRGDAVRGELAVAGRRIGALLWDRTMSGFADLYSVQVALDLDGDGSFDCREGSRELFETALRAIRVDSLALLIDTIHADGRTIVCRQVESPGAGSPDARVGSWMRDTIVRYQQPVSLWRECAANRFVLLYFFEGNSDAGMHDAGLQAMRAVMREHLGRVRLIGVNRMSSGHSSGVDDPVVEENQGWRGPLVSRFRNHRRQEVMCLDSLSTIVFRGSPDRTGLGLLWDALGRKDRHVALREFDRVVSRSAMLAKVSYE